MHSITLGELLKSRDERQEMQMRLLHEHPQQTLLCLTVVVPGSVKQCDQSLTVAHAAVDALTQEFQPLPGHILERDLPTGYEAYLIVDCDKQEAKRRTCQIEDTHPLGRLFDIDVMASDGTPIARQSIGCEPRKCLLCDNEARYCMRNHTHSQEELWQKIDQMVEDFKESNKSH